MFPSQGPHVKRKDFSSGYQHVRSILLDLLVDQRLHGMPFALPELGVGRLRGIGFEGRHQKTPYLESGTSSVEPLAFISRGVGDGADGSHTVATRGESPQQLRARDG
jgi:hypothetical protein